MTNRPRRSSPGLPKWVKPQLCKLVDAAPQGLERLHEIKYDGYRMHTRLDRGRVSLTRTGLDWTHKYSPVAEAMSVLPAKQAYLDGELCGIRPASSSAWGAASWSKWLKRSVPRAKAAALAVHADSQSRYWQGPPVSQKCDDSLTCKFFVLLKVTRPSRLAR